MTTATGQYAVDFTGASDEDPWVETGWTLRTALGGKIVSGALAVAGAGTDYRAHQYTGGSYSGGTTVVRVEIGAIADDNDFITLLVTDASGVGYILYVKSTSVLLFTSPNWTTIGSSVTSGSPTLATGDVIELSVTVGSPNTFSVSKNGSPVTLGTNSDSSVSISTPYAAVGFWPASELDQTIKSIGLDIATDVPAIPQPDAMTRRYLHLLIR